jgi:CBS domain-containing protein
MAIRDLMTRSVQVVKPNDSLLTAAKKMADLDIGFLPVCEGDRLVGALTDRDITVRGTARGRDPEKTIVSEVMTTDVTYCTEEEDIDRTARLMKDKQLRRVLVVDAKKKLVGVVSLGDLARQQMGQSAEVLEQVSEAPPNK